MPRVRAASASAAPWLPEECVTTPRSATASDSAHTALQAPRNLNAPTRCSCSHLKCSSQPASASSERDRCTGVTCACGAMRLAAVTTSAKVGRGESLASMRAMLARRPPAEQAHRGRAGDDQDRADIAGRADPFGRQQLWPLQMHQRNGRDAQQGRRREDRRDARGLPVRERFGEGPVRPDGVERAVGKHRPVQPVQPQQGRRMRERQQRDARGDIDQQQDLHRTQAHQKLLLQQCIRGPDDRADDHPRRSGQIPRRRLRGGELVAEEQQHADDQQGESAPLRGAERLAEQPDATQRHQQRGELDQQLCIGRRGVLHAEQVEHVVTQQQERGGGEHPPVSAVEGGVATQLPSRTEPGRGERHRDHEAEPRQRDRIEDLQRDLQRDRQRRPEQCGCQRERQPEAPAPGGSMQGHACSGAGRACWHPGRDKCVHACVEMLRTDSIQPADAARLHRGCPMNRKLLVPTLVATAALLAGCATGYQYQYRAGAAAGTGDYYYGHPEVEYHGYGYPYGSWYGGWGLGYGYGYPYWGYGYPFYGYPYYHHGHHHHHDGHDDSDVDIPDPPVTPPPSPQVGGVRPPHEPLRPGHTRTPPMVRAPSTTAPRLSTPMPQHQMVTPPPSPRVDPAPHNGPSPSFDDRPSHQEPIRTGQDRDDRRRSNR